MYTGLHIKYVYQVSPGIAKVGIWIWWPYSQACLGYESFIEKWSLVVSRARGGRV